MDDYIVYGIVFIYGILIGSFLNVCIYRIPEGQSIVTGRSHCTSCNTQLKWFELVPILSYLFFLGKCRSCKSRISIQYPIIEALNGIMYVLVFYFYGWDSIYTILLSSTYCLAVSALIVLSVIDFRTNIIPFGINIFLLVMGFSAVLIKFLEGGKVFSVLWSNIIGFFAVSLFLSIIFYASKGRAIGGGDIKLMAVVGLLLGWQLVILAFFLGCILAAIIHPIRMKISKAGKALAFGPYLSVGTVLAMLIGRQMISWYIETFFVY